MLDKSRRLLIVTSSPHVRSEDSVRSIMLDVIIALMPALAVGVFTFGARALIITLISVGSCVFFEWAYRKFTKGTKSIGDLSAVVTGLLIAFNLPVTAPVWMATAGALFAIVVVKQIYGGLGKNLFNPALAARVFLFLSWSSYMTTWTAPRTALNWFGNVSADVVTTATPLAVLKSGTGIASIDIRGLFLGQTGGCIGETSAMALLIGGLYLIFRRVINPRIPVAYLGTVAVISLIFPQHGCPSLEWTAYELLSGGLMLGAIFMATDYATSPVTPGGQWIFGAGCGLITIFIRYFGAYSEGVSFSILIMNALVWIIDMKFKPRRYGVERFRRLHGKRIAKTGKEAAK